MNEVLDAIRSDPKAALRHYSILIGGGLADPSGTATFDFVDENRTVPGFTTGHSGRKGVQKDRPCVRFNRVPGLALADGALGANQVNTYYVAMVQVNAPNAHYFLPDTGYDLCLTSMITGCVFGVGSQVPGGVLVGHVQPPGGATSQADARNFAEGGLTDGVRKVFQRGVNYNYGLTVIGLRKSAGMPGFRTQRWTFYGQRFGRAFDGGGIEGVV